MHAAVHTCVRPCVSASVMIVLLLVLCTEITPTCAPYMVLQNHNCA